MTTAAAEPLPPLRDPRPYPRCAREVVSPGTKLNVPRQICAVRVPDFASATSASSANVNGDRRSADDGLDDRSVAAPTDADGTSFDDGSSVAANVVTLI